VIFELRSRNFPEQSHEELQSGLSFESGTPGIESKSSNQSITEMSVVKNMLMNFSDVILASQDVLKQRTHK
jgi:hypothetical protein